MCTVQALPRGPALPSFYPGAACPWVLPLGAEVNWVHVHPRRKARPLKVLKPAEKRPRSGKMSQQAALPPVKRATSVQVLTRFVLHQLHFGKKAGGSFTRQITSWPYNFFSWPYKFFSCPSKMFSCPSKMFSCPCKIFSCPCKMFSCPRKKEWFQSEHLSPVSPTSCQILCRQQVFSSKHLYKGRLQK